MSKRKKTALPPHPMQPVVQDDHGVARFRANAIVRALLDRDTARGRVYPDFPARSDGGLNWIGEQEFTPDPRWPALRRRRKEDLVTRSKCPGNLRGHTWREPEQALLPEVPRRDLFALRVCLRCGEFGRISSQGVVFAVTPAEVKDSLLDQEVPK